MNLAVVFHMISTLTFRAKICICLVCAWCLTTSPLLTAAPPATPLVMTIHSDKTGEVERRENMLIVTPRDGSDAHVVEFPRVFARVQSVSWNDQAKSPLELQSEPQRWSVRWKSVPVGATSIEITFAEPPLLESETNPIRADGDGSFTLHAYQATTWGEKLRYEPQMHKNTVGYWTNLADSATWRLQLDQPGEFNVGVLQGCGAGQGGSEAKLTIAKNNDVIETLSFDTLDTGHFQNFLWRHLGKINVNESGELALTITATKIQKAALMDVRAITLTRLTAKR